MLEELKKRLEDVYVKIAKTDGDGLSDLCDDAWDLEARIEAIENPPEPPLTMDRFEWEYDVRREYDRLHDEYGDAAALYSDYLEYHYQDYLEDHKVGRSFSF